MPSNAGWQRGEAPLCGRPHKGAGRTTGPLRSNPKSEARNPKQIPIPKQTMPKTSGRSGVWDFGFSPLVLVSDFGLRFVLPKLHAKWLQYFVARNAFLDFLWAYFSAARPHIYKHLRKQEHWHCGTRRPRVSRNCDFGRWRSFVSFWFWLCQVRISDFGSRKLVVLARCTRSTQRGLFDLAILPSGRHVAEPDTPKGPAITG